MKQKYLRILSFLLSLFIFVDCSMTVYALPKRLRDGTWIDVPISEYGEEISYFIQYAVNQMGAFFTKDFETWLKNNETYQDLYDDNGRLEKNVSIDTKTGEVTYTKEIMIVLKNAVDEYAKEENSKEENGGFYLLPTTNISDVPVDRFISSQQMRTFRNIVLEKGCLAVRVRFEQPIRFVDPFSDPDHPILLVGDLSNLNRLETAPHLPVGSYFFCANCWNNHSYRVKVFPENDKIYTSVSDGIDYKSALSYDLNRVWAFTNFDFANHGSISEDFVLYSATGEIVRVFVSQNAAKNYTVGNRKVYFTENYYNYVPEDLSVSIDDLQKSVDDLQKVIDELLKQIGNDTSEKEIMDLLKQILEELRNQQGSGGGGGGGGGDVTVDIDLSSTNSLLSKILAKVSQIFDKMSETAGNTMDSVVDSIKNLERMLNKYLAAITGDLDDIKGKLDQMTEEEFGEKTDSFLSETMDSFSEIGGVAKTKFPFSLPNDMRLLIERITVKPVETVSLYSDSTSQVIPYSVEHGGGGASRPPGGIAYVEQGTAGECFALSPTGAPLIRCPIVIKSRNIDFSIVIDLSEFDKVATLSRTFLTLLFVYGLLNLTFKVMGLWGDLVE